MSDLGKAAAVLLTAAMGGGLVGCGQGAQTEHVGDAVGYVIIDRSAREAGVRLDGVSAADAVLPVEVSAASSQELVGPAGRQSLMLEADEVVYVRGRDAHVDRGALDADVARDRLSVVGSESAARSLADEIGGVVDKRGTRFVVVGPEALGGIARASMPDGLDEVVPVLPDDAAGKPAFGSVLVPGITAEQRATMRQAMPATAPSFDMSAFVKSRASEPADEVLPEAIDCPDPVVGTWVSREHYPEHHDWYRFELEVTRDAADPTRLQGAILSRSWSGGAGLSIPAICSDSEEESATFDWTVSMNALGRYDDGRVAFDGRSKRVDGTRCGPAFHPWRYNIDHFAGKLVEGGRFLQAVNNDGDRAVDEPHLFRRISCQ